MEIHQHTNRLIHETSPYLLQHAHNPVDWFPWGEEALEKAKKENKPVLVSIGYAACHWCHVMERESFENEETANLMNQYFVNIKIDREERPDIDHIYMDAVQAMTGSGGWPLNVFLTPDGRPFYGGTYFPPVRAFNRSSWREILEAIHTAYSEKKDEIEDQANKLTEHLTTSNAFGIAATEKYEGSFAENTLIEIATNLLKTADTTWGGFGAAPKFPQTFSIQFLLRHYHFTKDEKNLQQALLSLDKMIYGGIYDQVGGGFARYSTDEKWLAPHFEKMLYDNALLMSVLAEAFQLTGNDLYSNIIHHTMQFIQREMMNEEGGFYSALDADSEGVEGKFYTWSKAEVYDVLGAADAQTFCEFYGITENGNWEHTNILWVQKPIQQFAAEKQIGETELRNLLEASRLILLERRGKRVRPMLDDKISLGWNALMNIACCKAYAATGLAAYKDIAIKNSIFLEASFLDVSTGIWFHTHKNGISKYPAFLDDYAYMASAYIHLQEITGNSEYLQKAKKLAQIAEENFLDESSGFFFFTSKTQKDVIVRKKEVYDGATPSGNSTMAINLNYLGIIFNELKWIDQARKMAQQLADVVTRYPSSFANWACLLQQFIYGVPEIAITGDKALDLLSEVMREYIPIKVIQAATFSQETFPLLAGKSFQGPPSIYVCKNYSCKKPIQNVKEIKSLLI
ncbi:thioredoxin domain-containing protein [Segetibacter koreensis]|uniref:thioredoxin domain-containing protein n=1 Tax=Segetibacter koreensis TaxID=398037 RepID=UPI00037DB861|nr:thioredoxin domain-containing protein [Segetibacter koreensis]